MYIIAGLFNIIQAQHKDLGIDLGKIFTEFKTDINILNNPIAKLDANILGEYLEQAVSKERNNRVGLKAGFAIPFGLTATFFNLYHQSKTVRDLFSELEKFDSTANDITNYSIRIDNNLIYYEISINSAFVEKYPIAARQWSEMQYGIALQYAHSYTGRFIQPIWKFQ